VDRAGRGDLLLNHVSLHVAFDIVSGKDGSSHTIETFGEALDGGDNDVMAWTAPAPA